MLEIKDLYVNYGAVHALNGVSMTVKDGEIVSLIGANGAGKTTTLRTITGLEKAASGSRGRAIFLPSRRKARSTPFTYPLAEETRIARVSFTASFTAARSGMEGIYSSWYTAIRRISRTVRSSSVSAR